ncbi:MAG: chemotaxis protein [Alcanivorax borkumensis]|jgi:twitching motility protein PilJ|uniref:Putative methyl-accepting chemotaxis AlkN n=1 Tax=Alcanivorax borkumensis (strain ATCC 700651 / DSM 11573 / NCIMB 13689 / SK2) TaxID=393595 RepID=ALKN_ALCBS|nr:MULTISPECIES: methyl-accepting chemotaxis protein [Alcanivorax]Q0VTI9.1 RecName: Full=Putative methyl-accepting chemotaxis AlkN [Alcanivorax borkumensis SK2]OJH08871.1 MAG: chemotaxis protein [Alcanivorax borkumensis]BAP12959.1 type IV pilus biogenesis protein PilJ [Alcanivorax sp. NBRC 101098]CAL15554.1 Methyl-accepting chemotaxis protein [Alcanivorax borkumensis SK2]
MKFNSGALFEKLRGGAGEGNTLNIALYVGLAIFIVLALANFLLSATTANKAQENITRASEMRVISQQIAKNALEAAAGNADAFELLDKSQKGFQSAWNAVKDEQVSDPEAMARLQTLWDEVNANADVILKGEDTVLDLHEVADTLAQTIPSLQAEYEGVVEILVTTDAAPEQIAFAQRQSWLAERIVRSIAKVLEGGDGAVIAADSFGRDASLFGRIMNGMIEGDAAMGIDQVNDPDALDYLAEIADLFDEFVNQSVDEILETAPELFQVRNAADTIFRRSQDLLEESTNLNNQFENTTSGLFPSVWLGGVSAGLAVLFFFIIMAQRNRQAAKLKDELESENQRNQAAILRLLDELGDLADGDLTVQATVTEDFTGAIADSINYSIDQLRNLVQTINNSAVQVASAAQETQSTAMHLAEASEHQAQEIAGASAAVNEMAVSIDQVSANAAESAAVAERAVAIANKGAEVVQATIHGMDTIREQIQETSKRIKRLGESSQEIGDIVSLINDIADQTNILALNAAIQASMAGEAGRGFAVVADEVQRLAERSAAATKQIETLVKTIQTDTNEAVISMEATTAEVVKGARLAQDAGVALEEIESVSKTLADLIQNISNAARQQAASAGHISNTMNVIQEITSQTSAGTTATARSIGNLAEMAQDMRNSVAGFRLPEHS